MRYFQNARARRDNSLQVVLAHKRKHVANSPVSVIAVKSTAKYGVKNYLPPRPAGETDDTIASMVKMMSDENRKCRPNRTAVGEMMDQTFADRRALIVTELADISQVREKFPCLFHEDEVWSSVG